MKVLTLLLVIAAAVAHTAHRRLDPSRRAETGAATEVFPSITALKLLSLGHDSLVADYYWLRALNHFGDPRMHPLGYPKLPALLDRVLALDPYFVTGYIFAGTALTVKPFDPRPALALLEQGMRYRPEDWRLPFLFGFTSYYSLGDYARAARAMATASTLPGAPSHLGPLATRLAAEAGEPEIGLQLIDSVLDQVEDDKLRDRYADARQRLIAALHLKWLREAAQRYRATHGEPPAHLEELVREGLLTAVPENPLGGRYYLDADGQPRATNENELLSLPEGAKGVGL